MMYQVREIGFDSVFQFEAGTLDVAKGVEIAWMRHEPRENATIITCWHEPNIILANPRDPDTKATLSKL